MTVGVQYYFVLASGENSTVVRHLYNLPSVPPDIAGTQLALYM